MEECRVSEAREINMQVTCKSRPQGGCASRTSRWSRRRCRRSAEGEVLLKTLYLSLDPYMRGRMDDAKSYAKSVNLGDVMVGGTVSEVVQSKQPKFKPATSSSPAAAGSDTRRRQASADARAAGTSAVGIPRAGRDAGSHRVDGLVRHRQPKEGETVVVSAASGAVGSVVGQLAKEKGCRVVGIAGGPEKCAYVTDVLGLRRVHRLQARRLVQGIQGGDAGRRRRRSSRTSAAKSSTTCAADQSAGARSRSAA
jgi:NADPH-dependent curcumin reductase CurA